MKNKTAATTYYVYAYLDTRKPGLFQYGQFAFEYEPFYIGKGKGLRWKQHLTETTKHGKNPFKRAVIEKIIQETKLPPSVVFLRKEITAIEALQLEQTAIGTIGRRDIKQGPLTNLTDGGDGMLGHVVSAQQRQRVAQALKGKPKNAQHLKALRIANAFRRSKWLLTDPDGKVHTVDDLRSFCEDRGLIVRELHKIALRTSENKHIHRATKHKGWSAKKLLC